MLKFNKCDDLATMYKLFSMYKLFKMYKVFESVTISDSTMVDYMSNNLREQGRALITEDTNGEKNALTYIQVTTVDFTRHKFFFQLSRVYWI
jgi:hypothetical protein